MEINYGDIKIPVYEKKQKVDNQIIIIRSEGEIKLRIILSNELCKGSTKPVISLTNQIQIKLGGEATNIKDFIRKNLVMERLLTIKNV